MQLSKYRSLFVLVFSNVVNVLYTYTKRHGFSEGNYPQLVPVSFSVNDSTISVNIIAPRFSISRKTQCSRPHFVQINVEGHEGVG